MTASLDPTGAISPSVGALLDSARERGLDRDIPTTIAWCVDVGRRSPRVGEGRTQDAWDLLAGTAAISVTAARILEPHLDALSILHQASADAGDRADPDDLLGGLAADPRYSWGVFAAEGPGMRVDARESAGAWTLTGTKPWCSLAGDLTHALVTAWVDDTTRRLFAVDLRGAGVSARSGPWFARGLSDVVSAPVDFDGAAAVPVGGDGWYLRRPGFAWGGMSVAACWWGAASGLSEALLVAARSERADQLAEVHLGRADAALWAARATLAEAAALVDTRGAAALGEALLAERVRGIVADAASLVLAEADAALGPAPLVSDLAHARRVADLHLYLRQHHGPRDTARIGRALVARESG